MKDTTPLVEFDEVCVRYGSVLALREIHLDIRPAEIVSVIGTSGSGKSTLLRTMAGLLQPERGEVRMFGEDLYALSHDVRGRLMTRVGLLFQEGALFGSMTVLDNVMFPGRKLTNLPDDVIRELALTKLAQVGVSDLADRMPQDISGGQTKRVALARANLLDPRLVLCDEPTSGLDPINSTMLSRLLARARDQRGASVVLITHDMQTVVELSDRVLVVAAGELRAEGTPDELAHGRDSLVSALFHRERLTGGHGRWETGLP
jgi:phospholipid/cholesterol/gamma-HCH transport system ATP-binding protein